MFERIERNAVRLAVVVILAATVFGANILRAHASGSRTTYVPKNGNGPTVVILGGGFGSAEDSATLRLVDYDPAHNRIVYRLVKP